MRCHPLTRHALGLGPPTACGIHYSGLCRRAERQRPSIDRAALRLSCRERLPPEQPCPPPWGAGFPIAGGGTQLSWRSIPTCVFDFEIRWHFIQTAHHRGERPARLNTDIFIAEKFLAVVKLKIDALRCGPFQHTINHQSSGKLFPCQMLHRARDRSGVGDSAGRDCAGAECCDENPDRCQNLYGHGVSLQVDSPCDARPSHSPI